jgi:hypothetical protein
MNTESPSCGCDARCASEEPVVCALGSREQATRAAESRIRLAPAEKPVWVLTALWRKQRAQLRRPTNIVTVTSSPVVIDDRAPRVSLLIGQLHRASKGKHGGKCSYPKGCAPRCFAAR